MTKPRRGVPFHPSMRGPFSADVDMIEHIYDAFDRCDGGAMAECYLRDATFSDPVFGTLTGEQAGAMWRMLTSRAKDLKIELLEHDADEASGTARWRAQYEFAATGRPSHGRKK